MRDQGRRHDPGTDPVPLLAVDVLRDLLGAHETAVRAAQAHPHPFRIEVPRIHSRAADRLPVCFDGQERGAIHPRTRVRIHLDRDVIAEAAGQFAGEAACVEAGHLCDRIATVEQRLLHLGTVASQWREGSHSDDDGLVTLMRGVGHGVHSIAGRGFTTTRLGPIASLAARRASPSLASRSSPEPE